MRKVVLGRNGPLVSAQGLGCMGMSIFYGKPDDESSTQTIHKAIDLGANLIVTSDAYGKGANEELVGRAIKGRRDEVFLATKFGNLALGGANELGLSGGHPKWVIKACENSLKRLGEEVIDLYALHRVDPEVPIEDTVGAMAQLVEQGKVRFLGLSESGAETMRRASKVHPIAAVETEYSLWSRDIEPEILPACRELGVALMAYAPLGRGFLSGTIKDLTSLSDGDMRINHPRFAGGSLDQNLALLESVRIIASNHGATTAQVALAWVHSKGADVIPIPGTKRVKYLQENLAAIDLKLSAAELAQLDEAFPPTQVAGTRYPEKMMGTLGI
jgi:aryl-alcohol dehydrogenase-like predicted oxidoreductase